MRGRLRAALALALALGTGVFGCAVPPYQLPAGFSSTYQRQIYGMEPVPEDPHYVGAGVEARAGVFYPINAFHEQPALAEKPSDDAELSPIFLRSDPLSPPQTAKRDTPDAS